MDRSEASALADLQMHWDEAYVIALDGDIWSARYRSSADELRAHTSSELRELIRSDYAYRQKADLIAYDPDVDDDEDADNEDAGSGESAAGDGETAADSGGEQLDDPAAERRLNTGVGSFASMRGERMSM